MTSMTLTRSLASAGLVALALMAPASAFAGPKDIEVLQSYVGEWEGRGTFGGGSDGESVKCKLGVTSSEPTKVQFNGRCSLAGGAVTIRGSLGYIEERRRYEATMTSDAAFGGVAIGKRNGSGIDFTMKPAEGETDGDYAINAGLSLKDGKIVVKATITETASGASTTANVPMEKKS